jgi:fructose-bisphosphate aldolase class II
VARGFGAAVEAELGELPDASESNGGGGMVTDPNEATRFVSATGVDALAVSVGNVHLLTSGEADVDIGLLSRIHSAVAVPLVIHGGTGFPCRAVQPAIRAGVAKFNVGTRLKQVFLDGIRQAIAELPEHVDVHRAVGSRREGDVLAAGKARLKREIVSWIKLYGSAGQAERW